MTVDNQVFRITYEAFSRFSNNLIRCRDLQAVTACFRINLKYLFNFHTFRASYQRGNTFLHLQVSAGGANIEIANVPAYLPYEEELLEQRVPRHWTSITELDLPESYRLSAEEQAELWGWVIQIDADRHITVSVLSAGNRAFTRKDITFLKLVAENLEAKLFELCLLQELDSNNSRLEQALTTINEQNSVISSIMEYQKGVIVERTKEIASKNERLLEISVLNAHKVREPLSRVLGLINLLDMRPWSAEQVTADIMPRLRSSAQDLDGALKEVIEKSTSDLIKLQVTELQV
ncbi:hypothetical protein [Pontibacter akesuensis]|uniref:Signal transduction histidine kinase dimerisation/phosphoacceptor domain-containing protein n=1 Tax=Pontibacter akesuensis TaxID=388950 RepID=A0A1I7H2E2_9BACT|nr:hypothetical protein [Pontibacter akesuensis]GHA53875.1 hypothetical protein GCM10007389_01400 [Pontibacter akesuensis]SFU54782.1 hypothetical protein SAMN04487941_1440 [Pontibacter akesuensis]